MKIYQKKYDIYNGWQTKGNKQDDIPDANLLIVFGSCELLQNRTLYESIKKDYPSAQILISSTAGEIIDNEVNENSLSLTAIKLEKTEIITHKINITDVQNSYEAGLKLGKKFETKNLKSILLISDGQMVNGSDLVEGIQHALPKNTIITGGLAADGNRFKTTVVGLNEFPLAGRIAAIGFYGDNIQVTFGSLGGWDSFGPERLITRSENNILYELDHKPALDVYKLYLGEYSKELPASGLLFPLSLRSPENGPPIVRTILGIDENEKSLRFAGNMPQGVYTRLMKANFDRLIEGASHAAANSIEKINHKPQLAILISCVGRKLVLNQRIDEEVEVVKSVFGNETAITGFYSYGEISPSTKFSKCELHNQTMTITTFYES